MRLGVLAVKNAWRNKFRTTMTIGGVAVAIITFMLLRTVLDAWTGAVEYSAKDRIGTRHKITFIMTLPYKYVEEIRSVPGVKQATWANWFGGKDPAHETEFFGTVAVDPPSFLEVYDEILVPEDQKRDWLADRQGALVGDALAKKLGWKVGDRVTLVGSIFPGNWEFTIRGIYTAKRRSVDRSTFWFHWKYLNDSIPDRRKDQIGWVVSRIDDPSKSAEISKAIDDRFEEQDIQTLSMSERQLNTSFLGMFSAVLKAMDIVSIVILAIMALILGNTIAMGVRERTNEYGVLRAIGFLPRHIAGFVIGETVTIGACGGGLGLLIAYPLINGGVGRFLEENMGGMFPFFRISTSTAIMAMALAMGLGVVAAALPAWRAARLDVVDSLRKVG